MTQSFSSLLRLAFLIVGVWVAFAIFNSSEIYRLARDTGNNERWQAVLCYQLSASLLWAVFTPLIMAMAERLPLQKPYRLRNALLLLAIAPVFSVVRAVIGAVIYELNERGRITVDFIVLCINIRFHRNIFVFVIVVGIVNLVLLYRAAAERERNALLVRTAITKAEVQRLRSAMQPRLMFATLDAIGAKVTSRPDIADRMLVSLGALLRMMLAFGKLPDVSLADELDVVDRCLEIEKTRTQGAFTSRIDVDEQLLGARVPPLLLQTLVESSLSGESENPSRLEIRGRAAGSTLMLEFIDDRPERSPSLPGLEETKSRLLQTFGGRASVTWRREMSAVVTTIVIPLQLPGAPV